MSKTILTEEVLLKFKVFLINNAHEEIFVINLNCCPAIIKSK